MPQIKGTATWLTNVKCDLPLAGEKVGIDESEAKIENNKIEQNMIKDVDNLSLQKHRRRADQEFELRNARRAAADWRRMRELLGTNHVSAAMESRRHEYGNEAQANGQNQAANNYLMLDPARRRIKQVRPETTPAARAGFRSKKADADAEWHLRCKSSCSLRSNQIPRQKANGRKTAEFRPESTPVGTQPAKAMKTKSKKVTDVKDHAKRIRPKTSTGIYRPTPEESPCPDLSDTSAILYGRKTAGRSFQELKDLTHIDKISENMKIEKRQQFLREKELMRKEEAKRLQAKIKLFYADVEQFKEKTKEECLGSWRRKYILPAW